MKQKSRELFRLSEDFNVVDAAILIADGDPFLTEKYVSGDEYGDVEELTRRVIWQQEGVEAAFSALTSAVLHGRITARIKYRAVVDTYLPDNLLISPLDRNEVLVSLEGRSLEELRRLATDGPVDWNELRINTEPDWNLTTVNVEDLKLWLTKRNVRPSFFFDVDAPGQSKDVLNPSHDCFAAELAIALVAWQQVATSSLQKKSPKTVLTEWLNTHGNEHWFGDVELSESAKERISTVANWRPKGGAPRTGG